MLLAAGCGGPGVGTANRSGQGRTLSVAVFGGDYGNQARLLVGNLIEATTGGTVEYELGTSRLFLERLRKTRGSPSFDVVYLDGIIQNIAVGEDLLEPLAPGELRFQKDLSDQALIHQGYGPGFQFFSVGLAYNEEVFARLGLEGPREWADLWRLAPRLAGQVAIPDISHTAGMDLVLVALRLNGDHLGDPGAIERAIQKLRQLQPAEVYQSSIRSAEDLASGRFGILPTYNSRAFGKELDGAPVQWVNPRDKGFGHVTTISLTKGCRNRDLALAYMNAAVSPAVQIAQSLDAPVGPANTLTFEILGEYPEVARRFPLGRADMANLEVPPWDLVNAHRVEIEARFREVFPADAE